MTVTKTVPLLMLINELKRLKTESEVGDSQAADHLGCAASKINRIMTFTSKPSVGDAKMLGEAYGASAEMIDVLMDLARNLGKRGDWSGYRAVHHESVRQLVDMERHADRIRQARAEIIPGLLQTGDYVRALSHVPSPLGITKNEDQLVAARLDRQQVLERDVDVSFVLSESALRRVHGSREVMHEQLVRLIEVAQLPNVQLQVLPFANLNQTKCAWLSFALIHVPAYGLAAPLNYVHMELFNDARYIDELEVVERYERLWGTLQAGALGPVETVEFIGKVAEEYT